jgi:segregation and condensation protein A
MEQNQINTEIDELEEELNSDEIIYILDEFRGPLSVLLSLVTKNKMDIKDIQISVLCDQYMQYIEDMQSMNIDLAAEFIVMASHLMHIKSKVLLPRPSEDEEDPREALARALMLQAEYERAKEASQELNAMFTQFSGRFVKDTDEISADRSYVAEHDVNLLSAAVMKIMSTIRVQDEEIASEKIKPLISTRTVSVSERVYYILRLLLEKNGRINALECFADNRTRHEVVATFMAILEMLKAGRISIMEDVDAIQRDGVIDLANNIYLKLYPGKIRNTEEEQNG